MVNRFSLLLDESNDISIEKMLIMVSVFYNSNNCEKVESTYLDHIQRKICDAESIVSALRTFLAHNKFDVKTWLELVMITHL